MRGHEVLRDTPPSAAGEPEAALCLRIALFSRQPKPPHGFRVVLRHPSTLGIHHAESALRAGNTLVCGEPVQLDRLNLVLLGPDAEFVQRLCHGSLPNCLRPRSRCSRLSPAPGTT